MNIAPQILAPDSAKQFAEIRQLLTACELPISDIAPSGAMLFFGYRSDDELLGVIGLEVYGPVALLRSLAVAPSHRKHGTGRALVEFAEAYATKHGVESLYLLTTTAENFFSRLHYSIASREDAPPSIKSTAQFSGLCPCTSVFMSKRLRP